MPCVVNKRLSGYVYPSCVLDDGRPGDCRWTHPNTPEDQRITDKAKCTHWQEPPAPKSPEPSN